MYFESSPAALASDAAPCRRSWNRTGGKARPVGERLEPDRHPLAWDRRTVLAGEYEIRVRPVAAPGEPVSRLLRPPRPQRLAHGRRERTTRALASLFGPSPLPVSRTQAVPSSRSTSAQARPRTSSRRNPQ